MVNQNKIFLFRIKRQAKNGLSDWCPKDSNQGLRWLLTLHVGCAVRTVFSEHIRIVKRFRSSSEAARFHKVLYETTDTIFIDYKSRQCMPCIDCTAVRADLSHRYPYTSRRHNFTLRKHAHSNILKILSPKNEKNQIKNSNIFHVSAQNIDCEYSLEPPRWGGSNEYSQSVFWWEIRKIMYTPVNPSFTI